MNSCEDKIKWFCEKLFENMKMIFLLLSVLAIGIGIVGIEALSKRTNLPKEILAFVLVGLFTQIVLSIIDTLDQEKKTEPKDKAEYFDTEGNRVHYDPYKYDVISKTETRIGNSTETSYFVREKSNNPIREAIEKDKENLDQILDEDTSEEILAYVNTVSRTTPHSNKDDSPSAETDAPEVTNSIKGLTSEAIELNQKSNESTQPDSKTPVGDAIDTIRNNSETAVVKQKGRHLVIKATLKGDEQ